MLAGLIDARSLGQLILSIRGCVGLYLADELSGTIARDLTYTNPGTWTGTPTRGKPSPTPGDALPGTIYNSASNYILCKSGFILGNIANASVIVAHRAAVGATAGGSGAAMYCERGSAGSDIWKLEWIAGTPYNRFTHRNAAGSLTQITGTNTTTFGDGRPHISGLTKAGTAVRLFRDGAFDGSGTLNGNDTLNAATAESRLGADKGDAGGFFTQTLGFLALFNRTLTDGEQAVVARYALGG